MPFKSFFYQLYLQAQFQNPYIFMELLKMYEIWGSHGGEDITLILWVVTPCGLVDTNVSEEHTASILSPEDGGFTTPHFLSILLKLSPSHKGLVGKR
jgi:hypothetical protein